MTDGFDVKAFNRGVETLRKLPRAYLPVPVWDGRQWVPVSYDSPRGLAKLGKWPDGFDPARMGEPRFSHGDRVIYRDWRGTPRVGTVTKVTKTGGYLHAFQSIEDGIRERYLGMTKYSVQFEGDYHSPAIWESDLEQ